MKVMFAVPLKTVFLLLLIVTRQLMRSWTLYQLVTDFKVLMKIDDGEWKCFADLLKLNCLVVYLSMELTRHM